MTEPERYWDAPEGDSRRRVVQSALMDVPSADAKAKTMAVLGIARTVAPPPSARRWGRWLVTGVAGLALLGGWLLRNTGSSQPTAKIRDASADLALTAMAPPSVPAPIPVPVSPEIDTAPPAAPASVPASEKRHEVEDDLGAQLALIDGARALLAQGDPHGALMRLKEYESRYPAGSLGPEAMALRVEGLVKSGESARGRTLGERFVAQHPKSPYAARIRSLLGQTP